MERELVSYIIPIWAKSTKQEIERSINSLIPEYFLIKEILIIFDGHKSFTKKFKIPKTFQDKIKLIYCGINKGPGIARNKGATFVQSNYILFLDCGDESLPNRASIQLKSLLENDVSFDMITRDESAGTVIVFAK